MPDFIKLLKNFFSISIMRVFSALFSFVLFSLLARSWGAELLGQFSTLFAFFMFLLQIPLLGLHIVIARVVAAEPARIQSHCTNALILTLPVSIVLALAVGLAGEYLYAPELHTAFWLVGLACIPMAFTALSEALLTGQEKMDVIARVNIIEIITRVAVCLLLVLLGYGLTALFMVFMLSRVMAAIAYWRLSLGKVVDLSSFSTDLTGSLLRQCPTFFGILILSTAIGRFDTIFLSLIGSMKEVGLYAAPFKVYEMGLMVPSVITIVLFPMFSRLFAESQQRFKQLYQAMFRINFTAGFPLCMLLSLLSPLIVTTLFGDEYAESAIVLQLLSFAILFIAMDQVLTVVTLASHREDIELKILIVSFAAYLIMLLVLIPVLGYLGAALTTLLTTVFKFTIRYYAIRHIAGTRGLLTTIQKPSMAAAAMGLTVYLTHDLHLFVSVICSVTVYLAVMVLLRGLTRAELDTCLSVLAERNG